MMLPNMNGIVSNRFGFFFFYFSDIPQPHLLRMGGTAAACQA
jgi:hypothetical protein